MADDISYVSINDGCRRWQLGRNTMIRLAKESGAGRKIGKLVRIDVKAFEQYMDENCVLGK